MFGHLQPKLKNHKIKSSSDLAVPENEVNPKEPLRHGKDHDKPTGFWPP